MKQHACISFVVLTLLFTCALSENKYSRSANEKNTSGVNFRTLEKPFRMNKLNLVWIKAQQVIFMYSYLFTGKIIVKENDTHLLFIYICVFILKLCVSFSFCKYL